MNELSTNIRIVSLNDKGVPDAGDTSPVLGDVYLAPSRTDPETYDQWVWAGDSHGWQRIGSIPPSRDEETAMREERVNNVKKYFKQKREEAMIEKVWAQVPNWRMNAIQKDRRRD